jgi:hypothetical protein
MRRMVWLVDRDQRVPSLKVSTIINKARLVVSFPQHAQVPKRKRRFASCTGGQLHSRAGQEPCGVCANHVALRGSSDA